MIAVVLLLACWLLGAAALIIVRRRASRRRWLALFHRPSRVAKPGAAAWADRWRAGVVQSWRSRGAAWWGPMLGGGLGVAVGQAVSGAVAATVLGAYCAAGVMVFRRRAQRRSQARAHRVATDAVVALAADLRAGVAAAEALATADDSLRRAADLAIPAAIELVARRLASAAAVAQTTGAPLADLLERLDAHVRAVDRAYALALTQAAGARASAVLLAAMPAAGVGLGTAIGVDPARVLLHTTLGGAALCFAVALQLSGLAWTARLARVEAPA